jgi:D-cysteine desulfhydrase
VVIDLRRSSLCERGIGRIRWVHVSNVALRPPTFPTPLRRLDALSSDAAEIWVKDDGATHATYGGNKVRKVTRLLDDAVERGARRLLTFGAAGSHHVLTTALFARERGLGAAAVLTPQPRTDHAVRTLRAALGAGLEAYVAPTALLVPVVAARAFRTGDVVVPLGGSNLLGASGYVAAFDEILADFAAQGLEPPDWIVTAVGSGGTAAGLLAGSIAARAPTRILGVSIVSNPLAGALVGALSFGVLRKRGISPDAGTLRRKLTIEPDYVG